MRRNNDRFLNILIALLFLTFLLLTDNIIARGINDGSTYNPIVATFGKFKIFFAEYKAEYFEVLKQPEMYDSKKLRSEILDNLIINKLLSSEAIKMGLNRDEKLQLSITAFRDKCLRDAHFQKVIVPKIEISDSEIRKVYAYEQGQRRVSHLFFNTESEADSAYRLLKHGASFKAMAKEIFSNDTALANSGGDLGWVYWDQMDYNLAMAAFSLPLNTYSKPIKSQWGYHILEVTGYRIDPLLSEYNYKVHKYKAKMMIEYQLGEQIADEYIKKMLEKAKVVVSPKTLMFVKTALQNKFTRKPTKFDNMFPLHLNDKEIKIEETSLWDARHDIMATINGKPYTIEDFIGELPYVPYEAIYNDFFTSFNYAVRDFLLVKQAKKMGLGKDSGVKTNTELFSENMIALKLKKQLVADVKVSESEIKKYYEENPNQIKGAPYDMMRPIIEQQIKTTKQINVVPNYVKTMMGNMKITKRLDIINKYYDNLYNGNIVDKGNL